MLTFDPKDRNSITSYFSGKDLDELSVEDMAYVHLKKLTPSIGLKNVKISSSLFDLRESLAASFNNTRTNQYVPLMLSYAILDQIGSLYTPINTSSSYQNGIKRALGLFSALNKDEISSIVSLRNGLLHDGSLVSVSQHKNVDNVVFRFTKEGTDLIQHSTKKWDGVYRDSLSDYVSTINLVLFKELVEEICSKCFHLIENNQLVVSLNSPQEFFYKYLFARH